MSDKQNGVASTLKLIGGIEIVAGIIIGLAFGQEDSYSFEPNWPIILMVWSTGFVSGMLFIGIGEIIQQLHTLNHKDIKITNTSYPTTSIKEVDVNNSYVAKTQKYLASDQDKADAFASNIDEDDFLKLFDYYSSRNKKIKDIIVTVFDNEYIVKVQNDGNVLEIDLEVASIENDNIQCNSINDHNEIKKWYFDNKDNL